MGRIVGRVDHRLRGRGIRCMREASVRCSAGACPIEYQAHAQQQTGSTDQREKFRDECFNEHWFVTMAQARRVIENWRVEYNSRYSELMPPWERETQREVLEAAPVAAPSTQNREVRWSVEIGPRRPPTVRR